MSLAVLIPYRPDTPQRERIFALTSRLWAQQGAEVIHANDGLTGPLFSYARAANRARTRTTADCVLTYSVDALPLPPAALKRIDEQLSSGTPWSVVFSGQRRFTPQQTDQLLLGGDPLRVDPPQGETCPGREALLAVRAGVWDDLRGMDERFVGWGPEDLAFHRVLKTVHPDGCDVPQEGLFRSLWHPDAPRTAFPANEELWRSYWPYTDPASMRAWYLERP